MYKFLGILVGWALTQLLFCCGMGIVTGLFMSGPTLLRVLSGIAALIISSSITTATIGMEIIEPMLRKAVDEDC